MLVAIDTRKDYGETRYAGIGMLAGRTIYIVWAGHRNIRWIISARRASVKERQRYEAAGR